MSKGTELEPSDSHQSREGVWVRQRPERSVLSSRFWLLVTATFLFNLGVSIFQFLYNLLMLDVGFREKSLGMFAGAVALGSVAGTIPMGILAQRLGLKKVLAFCLLLMGAAFGARAYLILPPVQAAFSFFDGVMLCGWTVCITPAVAWVVEEDQRPAAFSILFAVAVAAGSLGGFSGGNMPLWMQWAAHHWAGFTLSGTAARRDTIVAASVITALAALPVILLSKESRPRTIGWIHRPSPFLVRFLIAIACWGAAVGAFNPFTNVLFSRYLHVATAKLGDLFAVTQLIQAGAVLLAPILFRRTGLARGLLLTQLITAAALVGLSSSGGLLWMEGMYCAYMAGQHMCDPAIQSLLMNRVAPELRSEAMAMTFLVLSIVQAGSASVAGAAFQQFHYTQVIATIAMAATVAAFLFRWLCNSVEKAGEPAVTTAES